ncbi:hypothetical protein [Photorhabdus africana]|uniref:hypothetical protein n=1 Tax=Photorhabdus africana TaxID=3097554 RepID=UPI002B4100DE|nr:hypothetical protein [Photorhabdus sp. CRI-LC]
MIKYNLSDSSGLDDFYLQYKDGSADWTEIAHHLHPDMVVNQEYESQETIKHWIRVRERRELKKMVCH